MSTHDSRRSVRVAAVAPSRPADTELLSGVHACAPGVDAARLSFTALPAIGVHAATAAPSPSTATVGLVGEPAVPSPSLESICAARHCAPDALAGSASATTNIARAARCIIRSPYR